MIGFASVDFARKTVEEKTESANSEDLSWTMQLVDFISIIKIIFLRK